MLGVKHHCSRSGSCCAIYILSLDSQNNICQRAEVNAFFFCVVLLLLIGLPALPFNSPNCLKNLHLETCLIRLQALANHQLGFWEWHEGPMVCFDGQNQSPSRKVKAEETGMEHERRERWKRRKRWNTRKTGHHLSSATLDDRCFLETLNLDFNIFKPHLTVYIQAIDNEFELFLPWTRLFGHLSIALHPI